MRETREELIEKFPSFNASRYDIVKILYGDEPNTYWDLEKYNYHRTLTGTLSNISAVDAYIFTKYGNYYIYSTRIGRVYIAEKGEVLCGDISVKHRGLKYDICLNLMYGFSALDILYLGGPSGVTGFSSSDGIGSPCSRKMTKELDKDKILRIINESLSDYGVGIQKFMKMVRQIYQRDPTNHILEKTFNC